MKIYGVLRLIGIVGVGTAAMVFSPVFGGDMSVDKLTVIKNESVSGNLNVYCENSASGITNGLLGFWPFDGNAEDYSGNGRHGAVNGTVSYPSGKYGLAASFAGDAYVALAGPCSIINEGTVSAWFLINNVTGSDAALVGHYTYGAPIMSYAIRIFPSDTGICAYAYTSLMGTEWDQASSHRSGLALKTWYHFAWVYKSTEGGQLYINGVAYGSKQGGGSLRTPSYNGSICGNGVNGRIDDLRIYNRALSSSEIYEIYSRPSQRIVMDKGRIIQYNTITTNIFYGKVGISTNTPSERLHVRGNMRVDGTGIVSALKIGDANVVTSWPKAGDLGGFATSNNFAEITVANRPAARANLGLGSIATHDAGEFLTPAGDGSQLTGITAAQVDALAPAGNGSQLTGITAAQVGALSVLGGNVGGNLSVDGTVEVDAFKLGGEAVLTRWRTLADFGGFASANSLAELQGGGAALARANLGLGSAAGHDPGDFLSPTGDGSLLTGITAGQIGAVSTSGGEISGELIQLIPGGDLCMGVFTNQPGQ